MFTDAVYFNNADKWLVAFYGYGQSADVYKPLSEKLKETHNVLVIDNPMQEYADDIQLQDFHEYLDLRLTELNIQLFSSVSFSMGSRLNLYLPLFYPDRLKQIILIAPDGITINYWNRIAVSPMGSKILKYFVKNGKLYLSILQFVYSIGIINKSLFAFSKWKMRDQKQREKVYNAWMNLRHFTPVLSEVNQAIEKKQIELTSYFGSNDNVIPQRVQKKCATSFPQGQHIIIETDHDLLTDELFDKLAIQLNKL